MVNVLLFSGIIQLIIILIVVGYVNSIRKSLNMLSEKVSKSSSLRHQAYTSKINGDEHAAKVLLIAALTDDIFLCMENKTNPVSDISVLRFNYKQYWQKCFKEPNSKQIDDRCDELIQLFELN